MTEPFAHTSGPKDARVVFVGEAFGAQEIEAKPKAVPFVGQSGREFFRVLCEQWSVDERLEKTMLSSMRDYGLGWLSVREAWLRKSSMLLTNVFQFRPISNNIESLCGSKADVGKDYQLPAYKQGKYFLPKHLGELARLKAELEAVRPNLVVALGATASWALLEAPKIGTVRGTTADSTLVPGLKVLPTYHPANVLYNWGNRPIFSADIIKAQREAQFPEIRRPERRCIINPTLSEIERWVEETLGGRYPLLGCDTETCFGQIECISFARSRSEALTVPFVDFQQRGNNYWPTLGDEIAAWKLVKRLLESDIAKIWQNGLYDLQYLCRHGIFPRNCIEDTMLRAHSLFPEMPKGLGFLGSIHTNESSWKLMNRKETTKRDE